MVSEIARRVMKAHGFTRKDLNRLEMQEAILDAVLEDHEADSGEKPKVHDRSAIDPIAYAVLTAKDEEEASWRKNYLLSNSRFRSALEAYRESTFILLKPVKKWIVDDGTRYIDNLDECYEVFVNILRECEIEFREIGSEIGFLEERVSWLMGLCML